jgi:hypothetical protein
LSRRTKATHSRSGSLNERPWKPYAQKSTPAEQILFLKVQNAYDVAARGQSDLGHDVGHSMVTPLGEFA